MITEGEAIVACTTARAKCGPFWKAAVRRAWESGRYDREGLKALECELQQVRNVFGPSWLYRLRLP